MSTTYTEDQYNTCYPPGIENHWWNIARSAQVARVVRTENPSDAVFLEVGCGRGLEVQSLRQAGLNVYGVELAAVSPLAGMEPYVASGIDAIDLPVAQKEQVTGLLLLDVIEHLPDPAAFLKGLAPHFPKLSVVIIAVPASQKLWSNFDVYYGHYRRYTTQMLLELGRTLDWEVKTTGYFFHLLYIPIRVLSWLGVERTTVFRAPAPAFRWLHRFIAFVNKVDNYLTPKSIGGTSAIAVFKVPR